MKCPECVTQNKASKLYVHGVKFQPQTYDPYWDEKENYHEHDPNRYPRDYYCSNGHRWTESLGVPCSAPECPYKGA